MSSRPSARRSVVPARRGRSVRRSSAGLSRVRAGAALAVMVAAAGIYGVSSSSAFDLTDIAITGTTFTNQDDVNTTIEGVKGQNLFTLQTAPLEAALRDLATVESAKVTIALPHTLDVAI